MNNNLVLSICIPTYNRQSVLCSTINNILNCKDERFEIVVLDNISTDETIQKLSEIQDLRLKVFSNKENIGGIANPIKVPLFAIAKYSMLILDKDSIDYNQLERFIDFLSTNELSHGYCNLNLLEDSDNFFFETGFDSLNATAYLSKHPSGMFWKTELYKSCPYVDHILKNHFTFGFYFEFINSYLAVNSGLSSLIYNGKLVSTEKPEDCKKIASKSYTRKNIFFFPKMRFQEYKMYINDFCNYNFEENKTIIMNHRLVKSYIGSLFCFLNLKKNTCILEHYGVNSSDIKYIYFYKYLVLFCFWYVFCCKSLSFFKRVKILFTLKG